MHTQMMEVYLAERIQMQVFHVMVLILYSRLGCEKYGIAQNEVKRKIVIFDYVFFNFSEFFVSLVREENNIAHLI